MRFLAVLLLICSFSSVYADDCGLVPLITIFYVGLISIFIIILGSLVKIGFVKHFTRVRKKDAVIIAIAMNIISLIIGLPVSYIMLSRLVYSSSYLTAMLGCFLLYISIVFLNTWIEGEIIQRKLLRSLSKTYRWLFVANAISIGISIIFALIFVLIKLGY